MSAPDYKIIRAMREYGGSFVAALGYAASCADQINLQKIREAFPEVWETYAGFVESADEDAGQGVLRG